MLRQIGLRMLAAIGLAFAVFNSVAAAPAAREFVQAPAISNVVLSQDGRHIAALTSADGEVSNISVWRTADLSAPPAVIALNRVRVTSLFFLKKDRLLVNTIQTFDMGGGAAGRTHLSRAFVSDLEGKVFRPLLPDTGVKTDLEAFFSKVSNAVLIDTLPNDPRHVIVIDGRLDTYGDTLKVDVYSGRSERLDRASERFGNPQTDLAGEIRARGEIGFEGGKAHFAQWIKGADGRWEEHFRSGAAEREVFSIGAFTKDPNILYVLSNRGRDKVGVYEYDIRTKKIGEPVFEHKLFNATGVIQSNGAADYGEVLGFAYAGPAASTYWTDGRIAALNKSLRQALGVKTVSVDWVDPGTGEAARLPVADGADAYITQYSADMQRFIVVKTGPSQPPEYYLLNSDGGLQLLGKQRPTLDLAALGRTRLVEYAARDGLRIPAILTTPPASFGPGPYPAVVLPHGGPWSRDEMAWDPSGWPQFLASRGYAVLQPQFRGSQGWGQKLWRAGDREWGQKMQDDKDDGARWMIAQKIAEPGRIAMFGYSYGGYAALAASIRPEGIYKCAISGAGGSLSSMKRATSQNRILRELQRPTVEGLDAIEHAGEVKIPLLLYHGDRDQIVPLKDSERFVARAKAAGAPVQYFEIADMGHTFDTWTPAMAERQLVEIERFLKQDCGAGGL
ncbi:MAG: S9 family peptidase [Caulobacteraceae bacterium]|nr:S9 family peptidase [Caulobacteraceae bacterium]